MPRVRELRLVAPERQAHFTVRVVDEDQFSFEKRLAAHLGGSDLRDIRRRTNNANDIHRGIHLYMRQIFELGG